MAFLRGLIRFSKSNSSSSIAHQLKYGSNKSDRPFFSDLFRRPSGCRQFSQQTVNDLNVCRTGPKDRSFDYLNFIASGVLGLVSGLAILKLVSLSYEMAEEVEEMNRKKRTDRESNQELRTKMAEWKELVLKLEQGAPPDVELVRKVEQELKLIELEIQKHNLKLNRRVY
ncbi:hypothetical protein ACP275_02G151900 [Erythranthe tilingii]